MGIEAFQQKLKYVRRRHDSLCQEEKGLVSMPDENKAAYRQELFSVCGNDLQLDFDDSLELVRKNIKKNREVLERLETIESNVLDALGEEFGDG